MGLKQISIFLENSPGRLYEVTTAFGEAGINLRALSLADTGGFGVLRLLVSDIASARKVVMERHWPSRVDDVVAVRIPDAPGSLAKVLRPLYENRRDIEYMYAFTGFASDEAVMIFRFRNNELAKEVLIKEGARILGAKEFGLLEREEA
jgi:hypothetical protein